MTGKLSPAITKLFQTRDELSFANIRTSLLPVVLVFPLSVIVGNLRFFDHSITLAGFESHILVFFFLGLGWLILAFTPKGLILPLFRLSAAISAVLVICQLFMPWGFGWYVLYMTIKVFNGLIVACAFYLFCFVLNNVERFFGMVLIQLYYSVYYSTWTIFSAVHAAGNVWVEVVLVIVYLVLVFLCRVRQQDIDTGSDGKGSGVPIVIGMGVVHYMIMRMINYIEWAESGVSILAFGLGTFISIGIVLIMQMLKGLNALYIWLLFLIFSLLGLGALLYDTQLTFIFGSLIYGLGDSLGYIIIFYMCAGAVKQSKSLRMYRLFCLVCFVEYFIISGIFTLYFNYFEEGPNKFLAFGIVLALVCLCFLFLPLIQKKLFEADWTDGLHLRDMEEYSESFEQTEKFNVKEHLKLTDREEEIFTLLLRGTAPKEIAYTLKISYDTVRFHQKNLYRKMHIQSRAELFAWYTSISSEKR